MWFVKAGRRGIGFSYPIMTLKLRWDLSHVTQISDIFLLVSPKIGHLDATESAMLDKSVILYGTLNSSIFII